MGYNLDYESNKNIHPSLKELLIMKVPLGAISAFCGTKNWRNVRAWALGWWNPKIEHQKMLDLMLKEQRAKKELKNLDMHVDNIEPSKVRG